MGIMPAATRNGRPRQDAARPTLGTAKVELRYHWGSEPRHPAPTRKGAPMELEYRRAAMADLGAVYAITQSTIGAVYPLYYPRPVVDWFLGWHDPDRIMADLSAGKVRLLTLGGTPIGTATCDGCHLTRIFVEPAYQRKGYGSFLLDSLEAEVGQQGHYGAVLDSSLPSGRFYQQRGYRTVAHESLEIRNPNQEVAAVLTWEVMEKPFAAAAQEPTVSATAAETGRPGANVVEISAEAADVMKQLPQMPF